MDRLGRAVLWFCIVLATVLSAGAAEKPRIFVTDSDSWQITGGFGAKGGAGGGATVGGARPQTVEIMKTVGENCPKAMVTIKQENADYVLVLEHEGGKGIAKKDNKVALFNKDGDMVYSGSTRSLGNAVKDACKVIR